MLVSRSQTGWHCPENFHNCTVALNALIRSMPKCIAWGNASKLHCYTVHLSHTPFTTTLASSAEKPIGRLIGGTTTFGKHCVSSQFLQ
jgi:hypothetical protein